MKSTKALLHSVTLAAAVLLSTSLSSTHSRLVEKVYAQEVQEHQAIATFELSQNTFERTSPENKGGENGGRHRYHLVK